MLIKSINKCLKYNNFEIFYIDNTTSTMDEAKSIIDKVSNNFVILANKQTKGRGRRGNLWVSAYGNLYCSIVISKYTSLNEYFKFNMLTSVSIKDSLEHIGINNVNFKWPNDIYFKQKKIAGILQETFVDKFKKKYLIIGIGINFQSSPNIGNYKTTHISKYVDEININQYFEIFINYFLYLFK